MEVNWSLHIQLYVLLKKEGKKTRCANGVRPTCRVVQGKAVVEDIIITQPKGVETKRGDAIIPDKKDPSTPDLSTKNRC